MFILLKYKAFEEGGKGGGGWIIYLVHCLQVAITTLEGGSWGYPLF